MTILDEILDRKRDEVAAAKAKRSPAELADAARACSDPTRGFHASLRAAPAPALITEIKHKSPSKGVIRADFDPVACARAYEAGGAAALSVLTDEHYFGGSLSFLPAVRQAVSLPLLRKDFVVDAYQIDEARLAGADAVLLIVAALSGDELVELHKAAEERGLDALVEVHDEEELDVALSAGARLVGVNNRDLRTFEVDLAVSERIAERLGDRPEILLVAESGIHTGDDLRRLHEAGAGAFLVGESLMRQRDLSVAVEELRRSM